MSALSECFVKRRALPTSSTRRARKHPKWRRSIQPDRCRACRPGDLTLCESQAIATYIDRAFPGPNFIPQDAAGAARVVQWTSYGNVKVDRWIMREFVVPSVFFDKTKGPDTVRIAAALPEIDNCCKALDDAIAQTGHLVGSRLTYADMNVIPMLSTLLNFPAGKDILAKYSSLSAYVARLADLPSFKNTAPPPRR